VNSGETQNPEPYDPPPEPLDPALRSSLRSNAASLTFLTLPGSTRQTRDFRCQKDLTGLLPRTPLKSTVSSESLKWLNLPRK